MTSVLTVYTLWKRELTRFYRQPNRVIGALASPLLFWVVIGSGVGHSFSSGDDSRLGYLGYFFPGTILMVILFTAIFSTISIIEDRHQGFLQSVLVAPSSRSSLALGKIFGGATLALIQGMLFLLIAPFLGLPLSFVSLISTVAIMFLLSFELTCLGFCLAWKMDSVQGFHAVMNLFLLPLWLLSGALFPPDGAFGWLKILMQLNPLHYGLSLLRNTLSQGAAMSNGWPPAGMSLVISLLFSAAIFIFSVGIASKQESAK